MDISFYSSFFEKRHKVAVIGGGSWATAIVKMLLDNAKPKSKIFWYMRSPENIAHILKHKHNPKYISSAGLDVSRLALTNCIDDAVRESEILIFAIPAAFLKKALEKLTEPLSKKLVVSAIKGIIPNDNLIVGEYFIEKYGVDSKNVGVISGPCHAEEVALERLSYLTIASKNLENAKLVASLIETRYIRTSVSTDIFGIEYGAVMKNIFALMAGVAHGIGYGDNFQAALISKAIQEMNHFLEAVDNQPRNINNSVYLGDLLVTAYSQFSRNRTFGNMIGKGYSVKSAQLEMNMVAEGYYATRCIKEINDKYNIDLPICTAAFHILYEGISPALEINLLSQSIE